MIRRAAQAILLPVIVLGGYVLLGGAGGFVEDVWEDFAGPFLITYWIGFGFTMAWDIVTESMRTEAASPTVVGLTGLLSAVVILMMLGGPGALIEDPWLFGVAIAPGLRLAEPWLARRRAGGEEAELDS
ncbi:MAG TPA: hypothetical protein VFS30_07925 [Dehalococcoidia bacterium]|nr:hypothetical protein [Dehalococcoidia bacterium]